MEYGGNTIYLSILQCINYCCDTTLTHAQLFLRLELAVLFSLLRRFRYTQLVVLPIFGSIKLCQIWLIFKMETSKRIPTMNACANFSFRGLRKKNNFTLFRSFREYFRHAERNYFRHVSKLHTSQQRQPHTKPSTRTHGRFYYGRSNFSDVYLNRQNELCQKLRNLLNFVEVMSKIVVVFRTRCI